MKRSFLLVLLCLSISVQNFAQSELWGMTYAGGSNYLGTIFKTGADGTNQSIEYTFSTNFPGGNPLYSHLTDIGNGKLYGMTYNGGSKNRGVIFEYDPSANTYSVKKEFSDPDQSGFPMGSLTQANNGKLYGVVPTGGAGVLFEFDPATSTYTKKFDFVSADGAFPEGSLVYLSNGKMYGVTQGGGANGLGVLYEYDPSTNSYSKKIDFDGTNGAAPQGNELFLASNGKLYGLTFSGGSNQLGVLFEYDPYSNILTKKVDFDGANLGKNPQGGLVETSNGKLYGMTLSGGSNDQGVLFEYDPATNSFTKKIDFNNSNGSLPMNGLTLGTNGNLYGVSSAGGSGANGILFEYDPTTSTLTKRFDFKADGNGSLPRGCMTLSSNGKLYGMTSYGGASNDGVIFEFNPANNTYTKKIDFNYAPDGERPTGNVSLHINKKFYGMTSTGGLNDVGVIFEFDPVSRVYTKKIDFDGGNGSKPNGSLVLSPDGKFYGMTFRGGVNNQGIIFSYDPSSNTLSKKIDFDGSGNGSSPWGSLYLATNGKFYGMTNGGGANQQGVIFEFDPTTNQITRKFDFDGAVNGSSPFGDLIQASNGKLYGTTGYGGANNKGVLFEYDITSSAFAKKAEFETQTSGEYPWGGLYQASNGMLYGMTTYGGTKGRGVLFEFDPSISVFSKKVDLEFDVTGGSPYGVMVESSNHKLYGLAAVGVSLSGRPGNGGTLFEFDPSNGSYTVKQDFTQATGCNPQLGSSLVFSNSYQLKANQSITFNALPSRTLGDQPFSLTATSSSGLLVTYSSSDPTVASINGSTVAILKAGTATIIAHQYGDANTNPAQDVQQTLIINSVISNNGKIWGLSFRGGVDDGGAIFSANLDGTNLQSHFTFSKSQGVFTNGIKPLGDLTQFNGKFYGMTWGGGANNLGVLFEFDPATSSLIVKKDFDTSTGSSPYGNLCVYNGKLYGLTSANGAYNNAGTLFAYDPVSNTFNKVFDFGPKGAGEEFTSMMNPYGSLTVHPNGKLYGMTWVGGATAQGTIFEFDAALGTVTRKIDFDGAEHGATPAGSLTVGNNGNLYGLTRTGGANNLGVLFEYNPSNNTLTKRFDFDGASHGATPQGNLFLHSNGKLYGLSPTGGSNDVGVLFEYDPASLSLTKKFDLSGVSGMYPQGSLIEMPNGKLYGTTENGGIHSLGTLFTYDPTINSYSKIADFDGTSGAYLHGSLIFVKSSQTITFNEIPAKVVGDAAFALAATSSSGLTVTYTSSDPSVASVNANVITIIKAGTVVITAHQNGDASTEAALDVQRTLTINSNSGNSGGGGSSSGQGQLWGVSYGGGADYLGTIFKTNADGTGITAEYSFATNFSGAHPAQTRLVEVNGKMYGMTKNGGTKNHGVIFEYDYATNSYSEKINFGDQENIGFNLGSFCLASNGKFYATTEWGGANGIGVLFEYDPVSGSYAKKYDFSSSTGSNPRGSLVAALNGKLYSMTGYGGANNVGVIYEYDPTSNTYTKKIDFDGLNGASASGNELILASNGKLYGMTRLGGTSNSGVLFEYDPTSNTLTKRFDFTSANGVNPEAGLVQAGNGSIYGMTFSGGANGNGVIFEFDPSDNSFNKKFDFDESNGSGPLGSLTLASNGKLYGMTAYGGIGANGSSGTLFEFDPVSGNFNSKKKFSYNLDGYAPQGSLVLASNGKLYGMNAYGGASNDGVIFEYDISTETYTKKIDFNYAPDGMRPNGRLTQCNGKLYGLTQNGGINSKGTLFEFDPVSKTCTKKIDLDGIATGERLFSSLVLFNNRLYGTLTFGGSNGKGALFQYDPATEEFQKKIDFDGSAKGGHPYGSLTVSSNGKLYGLTSEGGSNDVGILFEYDPANGSFAKKIDFDYAATGGAPLGSLVLGSNGKMYGMTYTGGDGGVGVVFEYEPGSSSITKKCNLSNESGGSPWFGAELTESGGKLYAMTPMGGKDNYGTLIEYDPALNSVSKKLDMDVVHFWNWFGGSLVQSSNGKLYGMAYGSSHPGGFVFEYDPATNSMSYRSDFNEANVADPLVAAALIYVGPKNAQTITFNSLSTKTYGDPNFNLTATSSAGLTVSYSSSNPGIASVNGNVVTIHGAGNVTISAYQIGNTNTLPAQEVQQVLTINKAILTATAENKIKTYGSTNPTFTISYTGFKGSDSAEGIDEPPSITTTATQFSNVDSYSIKLADGSDNNYTFNLNDGVLKINKAELKVTADNKSKVYGTANPTLTFSYSGFLGADNSSMIDTAPSISTKAAQFSDAGNYAINLLGGNDNNYNLNLTDGILTILKAEQTIQFASLADKTIGDLPFNLLATASSGLDINFSNVSSKPELITLTGNKITINQAGMVSIAALQPGTISYNAATSVVRSFCVLPQPPVVTLSTSSGAAKLTSNVSQGNQWFLDGAAISGATGSTILVTTNGAYSAQVSVDGCVSKFSNEVRFTVTGEITSVEPVILFPNPSNDFVLIKGVQSNPKQCVVSDALGHQYVISLNQEENLLSADIRGLAPGVYVLSVNDQSKTHILRFARK